MTEQRIEAEATATGVMADGSEILFLVSLVYKLKDQALIEDSMPLLGEAIRSVGDSLGIREGTVSISSMSASSVNEAD